MIHSDGPRTGRPPTFAPNGMICTSHSLASAAGLTTLRNGGSAVDAAIAANAALCVAYPHMAGLGGDGFWLIAAPNEHNIRAINASGPAAQSATREYYLEARNVERIPDRGPLAALTVPGAVDGWRIAHQEYGNLDWDALFDDSIIYARDGVPVGRSLADWLVEDESELRRHKSAGSVYLPGGSRPEQGDHLKQPSLADSIQTIANLGARGGFYEGEIAEHICQDLGSRGSPLSPADFGEYKAEWVDPISTEYRGFTAYEFPPNTQGFAALQVLNSLEGYNVQSWGDGTADYYHHCAESVKLAFADRDEWLTDPQFVDIPVEEFLSKQYANKRRELIAKDSAMVMEHVDPGISFQRGDRTNQVSHPGGDTVYFCAVDSNGLVASVIQSIYHDFGSMEMGGDTGILLQNRGSYFSLDDDHPNRLEPGKRTFHTLMPAMLCEEGEPYLAYGTMGGEGQPQTHAAIVTRLVDFGYDVQQAIEAPRWLMGKTWGEDSQELSLEGRIPDEVIRELDRRGQPVKMLPDWDDNMGHAQAIRIHRETGMLEGGADPRGDGAAMGY